MRSTHEVGVGHSRLEGATAMRMKMELIPLPVSDVDRAVEFYADKLGLAKDFDVEPGEGVRIVQLPAEGSGCSIGFWPGIEVYPSRSRHRPRPAPGGGGHRRGSCRA